MYISGEGGTEEVHLEPPRQEEEGAEEEQEQKVSQSWGHELACRGEEGLLCESGGQTREGVYECESHCTRKNGSGFHFRC